MGVIKKTVVIHPIMDFYIRKTWAMLVDNGIDATYSSALNFMLLATILEATSKGISEKTKNLIWNFAHDQKTMEELNLQDFVATFEEKIKMDKTKDYVS